MSPRAPVLLLAPLALAACDWTRTPPPDDRPPAPVTSAPVIKTPPVSFGVAPAPRLAEAGGAEPGPPLDQAREYAASGQLWLARLVLEKKALGSDATKDETELLARICVEQGDEVCAGQCGAKLGRKRGLDAGAPRATDAGR